MIRLVAGAVLAFGLLSVAPASPIAASAPAKASTQETNLTDPKSILAALGASVFAKKDFSQLDQLISDDYIQHNPLVSQGSKGFREFFEAWFKAVPDFKYELKKIVSEADLVWAYGTYSGTQTGDWLGIPATGKAYAFESIARGREQSATQTRKRSPNRCIAYRSDTVAPIDRDQFRQPLDDSNFHNVGDRRKAKPM